MSMNEPTRPIIAPSILSADFSCLGKEIAAVDSAGANWIHIDVMDGHFVPNITIGPVVVMGLRKTTKLPFDVHLMIENPDLYISEFIAAGANYVTVHQEATKHLHRTIATIHELGAKAGVSINPATPPESLLEVLSEIDLVLVMSVNPGFGGQIFIESSISKIEKLNRWRRELNFDFLIEIDGGINSSNSRRVSAAGADVLVAGSAIYGQKNYTRAISNLRMGR